MMEIFNPLISVIIPCYNVARYVEKAVTSVINQTYHNLEIWIVDDASTDNTLEKINLFKDERIKIICLQENTQKIGAVNEVLKQVKGDLIAFQDADDWSEPDRIEEQVKEFRKDSGLGICFTNYRCLGRKTFLPKKISLTNDELRNEFLNYTYKANSDTSPTNCPTMMISKAALEKTGGYHPYFVGKVAEDIQWIYRVLKDFKGITVDKILYNYQSREGSFSHVQSTGVKPKYVYSWVLLSKIIHKDVYEGINVLAQENKELLKDLELEACEEVLAENIRLINDTRWIYENSTNFKVGKFVLSPLRLLLKIFLIFKAFLQSQIKKIHFSY